MEAERARARIPVNALLALEIQGAIEGRMTRYDAITGHPLRDHENNPVQDELSPAERTKYVHHLVDKCLASPKSVEVTSTVLDARNTAMDAIEHADAQTLRKIADGTYSPVEEGDEEDNAGVLDALIAGDEDEDSE
jgi:hypothetical protein